MPKHYLIFIHGIGELKDNNPSSLGYDNLWKRLIQQSGRTSTAFEQQFGRIDVIWHVEELQNAGKAIFDSSFPNLKPGKLNPMHRLRNFMTFFAGDVAAYVSEDVNFVRRTVWEQIWAFKDGGKPFKELLEEGATYSIVAHSLGSVIAFDYLFDLFHPQKPKLFVPSPDPQVRPEDAQLTVKEQTLSSVTVDELTRLQEHFRHLFTMGSPIGLFLMRKGNLWANDEPFTTVYNPIRQEGRTWYNFWDSNDPIAYPVAQLFSRNANNNECKLLDIPVETGWIFSAHVDYWKNRTVAQKIMNQLTADM